MKKVKAAKICNIDFYKSSSKKLCTGNKKNNITFSTKAQQEQFLTSIQNTDAVCLSSFSDFCSSFIPSLPAPPKFKLPIDFRTLYQPDVNFEERKIYALASLLITKEETQHLELLTTEQSNSVTWNQFRVGRITSSVVHRVLRTDFNHPSKSLIKTICCPAKSVSVPAIQWGREKESEAFHQYSQVMSEHHSNFSVTKSGLHLSMDSSFLGASPDGMSICTCCGIGVLEIKCPFNFRYDDNFLDLNDSDKNEQEQELTIDNNSETDMVWTTVKPKNKRVRSNPNDSEKIMDITVSPSKKQKSTRPNNKDDKSTGNKNNDNNRKQGQGQSDQNTKAKSGIRTRNALSKDSVLVIVAITEIPENTYFNSIKMENMILNSFPKLKETGMWTKYRVNKRHQGKCYVTLPKDHFNENVFEVIKSQTGFQNSKVKVIKGINDVPEKTHKVVAIGVHQTISEDDIKTELAKNNVK